MKALIPWRRKHERHLPAVSESRALDLMHRRMDDIFDDLFEGFEEMFSEMPLMRRNPEWLAETPSFEVSETDDEFRVRAELPGMDEKDIEVTLEGDELMVRGEKKREHEEERRDYRVSELSYGEFCRTFTLPEGVDREKAKATFKKGVLTLTLPKTEQGKTQHKRIEIAA